MTKIRTAPQPVRHAAAEILRRLLAEIEADRLDAPQAVRGYLTGLAEGLEA